MLQFKPLKNNNYLHAGFAPIWIITVVIICLVGITVFVGKERMKLPSNSVEVKSPASLSSIDKSDSKWMEEYCQQEMHKLPKPPFKYNEVRDPANMSEGSSSWVVKGVAQDKRVFHSKDCAIEYMYDEKIAFPSVGVKYSFDIKASNQFEKIVDELLTPKFDRSWKKISPLTQEDSGNPGYSYQAFPLVFRRENSQLGTIEFASADFNAGGILINFYVAEK